MSFHRAIKYAVAFFAAFALLLAAPLAANAADSPAPVTIRVEADLPGDRSGPAIWEVTDVVPGPGIELTGTHLISNPSNWVGSFLVDIDPEAGTILISGNPDDPDFPGGFELLVVTVTSADYQDATFALDEDTLFKSEPDEVLELTWGHSGTTLTAQWGSDTDVFAYEEGSALFSYVLADNSDDETDNGGDDVVDEGDEGDEDADDTAADRGSHPTVAPKAGFADSNTGMVAGITAATLLALAIAGTATLRKYNS